MKLVIGVDNRPNVSLFVLKLTTKSIIGKSTSFSYSTTKYTYIYVNIKIQICTVRLHKLNYRRELYPEHTLYKIDLTNATIVKVKSTTTIIIMSLFPFQCITNCINLTNVEDFCGTIYYIILIHVNFIFLL